VDTIELIQKAATLEAAGNWQTLHAFSKAWVCSQPNNLLAWQSLGTAARRLGNSEEAIAAFKQGISVAPPEPFDFFGKTLTSGPLLFNLAHTYAEAGSIDLAKATFREAGRVDPNTVAIWNDLGVVCMNNQDAFGAFEAFKKAVSIDDGNINSLRNLGILYAFSNNQDGVRFVHRRLADLDVRAANDFLQQAVQLQAT
jgi:Flp pilus assembly protein TadD